LESRLMLNRAGTLTFIASKFILYFAGTFGKGAVICDLLALLVPRKCRHFLGRESERLFRHF
jgi:hypothetical protein